MRVMPRRETVPGLRVTQFRVLNYRNIDDSGWIPIERVTALVGRNESGKTTLLRALHKFNPATPEPYQPQREFPRDRFAKEFKNGKDWPVCQVEFEIDEGLRARFLQDGRYDQLPTHFTATRYYDGHLVVEFSPEFIEAAISPELLAHALARFTAGLAGAHAPYAEDELAATRARLTEWATQIESEARTLTSLNSKEGIALLTRVADAASRYSTPLTSKLSEQLAAAAGELLDQVQKPSTLPRLAELAVARMPVFIYFEQYGILSSAVYLPHLLDQPHREPSNPRVRTVNAIFKHVGLTAQEIFELGRDVVEERRRRGEPVTDQMIEEEMAKRELRQVKLSSASLDITTKFSGRWHQRRHQIRYHADGPYFRIWVADDRRPGVEIELESRSKGFQWFFSFNLVFLVESEEGHKDAVLLLDEPGLDLHPTAQQELVAFFEEELSRGHQLLYTTHSPFLIDGDHLERIRPVREDASGHSEVSAVGMWPDDRETMFPLHAAAGYAMVKNLFDGKKNLLVEDLADCLYIQGLALVLGAARRQALPNDVCITPCGGTTNLGYLTSLLRGHNVRPVILLDSNDVTRTHRQPLLKELHAGEHTSFMLLGEVRVLAECGIEDNAGDNLILPAVSRLAGTLISISAAVARPTRTDHDN